MPGSTWDFHWDADEDSIDHLDVEIAGSGAFIHSLAMVFDNRAWGHCLDLDGIDEGGSRSFASVPDPLHTVPRSE